MNVLRDLTWSVNHLAVHNGFRTSSDPLLVNARNNIAMTMSQPRIFRKLGIRSDSPLLLIGLSPAPRRAARFNDVKTRPKSVTKTPYPARVSDNRRFLLDQFGKPFFYLGDTAWELFHRLNPTRRISTSRTARRRSSTSSRRSFWRSHGPARTQPQGHPAEG